jgi:hypothetical protein
LTHTSAAVNQNSSPSEPENLATFNPFWEPHGTPGAHVSIIFESFNLNGCDDLFDGHKREDMESTARILLSSGKMFNYSEVLAATS